MCLCRPKRVKQRTTKTMRDGGRDAPVRRRQRERRERKGAGQEAEQNPDYTGADGGAERTPGKSGHLALHLPTPSLFLLT
jgi:hypothetical protein